MHNEFTKLIYFYCNQDDIFLEVYLSKKSHISFSYRGEVLIKRGLLLKEVGLIKSQLMKLHLQLTRNDDLMDVVMHPDMESRLVIYRDRLSLDMRWSMSDVENYPYFYSPVEALVDLLMDLAAIAELNIELPIYE